LACDEKDYPTTAYGVSDPIHDLPWLLEMKESLSAGGMFDLFNILKAITRGKEFFIRVLALHNVVRH